MVVQDDLGVRELLVNKFAVSNILDHRTNQHYNEVLVQRNEHNHSLHLVHAAHTNYGNCMFDPCQEGMPACF
jgi:hypothetical protein